MQKQWQLLQKVLSSCRKAGELQQADQKQYLHLIQRRKDRTIRQVQIKAFRANLVFRYLTIKVQSEPQDHQYSKELSVGLKQISEQSAEQKQSPPQMTFRKSNRRIANTHLLTTKRSSAQFGELTIKGQTCCFEQRKTMKKSTKVRVRQKPKVVSQVYIMPRINSRNRTIKQHNTWLKPQPIRLSEYKHESEIDKFENQVYNYLLKEKASSPDLEYDSQKIIRNRKKSYAALSNNNNQIDQESQDKNDIQQLNNKKSRNSLSFELQIKDQNQQSQIPIKATGKHRVLFRPTKQKPKKNETITSKKIISLKEYKHPFQREPQHNKLKVFQYNNLEAKFQNQKWVLQEFKQQTKNKEQLIRRNQGQQGKLVSSLFTVRQLFQQQVKQYVVQDQNQFDLSDQINEKLCEYLYQLKDTLQFTNQRQESQFIKNACAALLKRLSDIKNLQGRQVQQIQLEDFLQIIQIN